MNRIFLYGIGGPEYQYRVLRYYVMNREYASIENIKFEADEMRLKNPSINRVYAMDDRYGLKRDYMESIKTNSIESCAVFKDLLERDGLLIN